MALTSRQPEGGAIDTHVHDLSLHAATVAPAWPWVTLLVALGVAYAVALLRQPGGKRWSPWRTLSWLAGIAIAGIALIGPLAEAAHADFRDHMLVHLLLGMLAPILLVLGAPVTLALRALPVPRARQVVRLLASPPLRLVAHPITAALLNVGGLTLLYRTDLYRLMHEQAAISVLVHLHVLAAGYLFTAALIGIDPIAHRPSYRHRLVVMVAAFAAHAILAKSLYASPPPGVPIARAEAGSQLMYYGGDIVDLLLVTIFCWQWYRATAPRPAPSTRPAPAGIT